MVSTYMYVAEVHHYRQVIAWHMINDSRQRTLDISIVVVSKVHCTSIALKCEYYPMS